jgi:hypothetical protein
MKRRAVLRSLLAIPSVAALPSEAFAQQGKATPSTDTPNTQTTDVDSTSDSVVKTFNSAQFAALRKLGEIVMPAEQDTPGATEAGAAEFLDFLIGVSPAPRVALYKTGLDRLNSDAQQRYHKSFSELTADQAAPILAPLRAAWSYKTPSDPFAAFLLAAKNDLLTATTNSREYIAVVSQRRRSAGGVGLYWYPIE